MIFKKIFCFILSLVMVTTHASNQFLSDFTLKKQFLDEEITQLNQEFDARLRNRIDYLQTLKVNHYRNSIYGAIGGLVIEYCVGLSIDTLFDQNDSGYAIPLTVIGSFLGCCSVQAYQIGVCYLIQRLSDLDELSHGLELIRKYSEFFKGVSLALKTLEPEPHQLP